MGLASDLHTILSGPISLRSGEVLFCSDARAVIAREHEWKPKKQNPVLDEEFLVRLACNWDWLSELDVSKLFDVVASDQSFFTKHQARHRKHKDYFKQLFDNFRNRYRTDGEWRRRLDNASYSYVPGTPATEYICNQIVRECIVTHEQFNATDGLDFEHCVVPLAYCDYVVLDTKWARRCRKIIIPPGGATVFSIVEIDSLLRQIKLWPKAPRPTSL